MKKILRPAVSLLTGFFVLSLAALPTAASADSVKIDQNDTTKSLRNAHKMRFSQRRPRRAKAKNIILFIGDGMGISTVTAARILEGQLRGENGEENFLEFENLPNVALSKTYNTNQQVPDSAGTMTAMMTGEKTKAGVISVDRTVTRGDCASAKGHSLRTFLEEAEIAGKSTGVVTTTRLTHATPAATYAHVPERNWEDDHDLPAEAVADGCKDIARQLIEFPYGDGLEVAMGGGRRNFWPRNEADPEDTIKTGERDDNRNLAEEWVNNYNNADFVWNQAQFDAIDPAKVDHLLGLFNRSHMQYEYDRPNDIAGEPSLSQMTAKSIEILKKNKKGFFLMVEGGRIDHAHHAGNAFRALTDTIEFSKAVKMAEEMTNDTDTLIIVTADHSHVFTMGGYPTRGNPILGKVIGNDSSGNPEPSYKLAKDGMPFTTLGYQNGRGFANLATGGDTHYGVPINTGRVTDLTNIDTEGQGFHQEALIPLDSETHAGEDVAIYSGGPGSRMFHGVQEQTIIYDVMEKAGFTNSSDHRAERE